MKKIICFFALSLILWGCVSSQQQYDIRNLTVGMSKNEVRSLIGPPERYLSFSRTPYGYEEILQYRNIYNEPYALEFINGYLAAANYIYNDMYYPMYPSASRPSRGKSVFPPNYRPNRPALPPSQVSRPGQSNSPGNTMAPASSREPTNNRNNATTRPSSRQENATTPASSREPASNNNNTNTSRPSSRQESNTQQNSRSTTTDQDSGRESSRQSTSSDRENSSSNNGRR